MATEDAEASVQRFIARMEEKLGAPSRRVTLYVKGLQRHEDFEAMQSKLSQYHVYGVEKVNGLAFDPALSKYLLTFSEQSMVVDPDRSPARLSRGGRALLPVLSAGDRGPCVADVRCQAAYGAGQIQRGDSQIRVGPPPCTAGCDNCNANSNVL